jgi:hypothetical protein
MCHKPLYGDLMKRARRYQHADDSQHHADAENYQHVSVER